MGRIIEGSWSCSHCGQKQILARYKNCPNCGAPQGKDTTFKMHDSQKYVSKEETKNISKNPDWLCSFCEQLNSDKDSNCKGCGASKEDSELNYFQMKQKEKEKTLEIENDNMDEIKESGKDNNSPKETYWKCFECGTLNLYSRGYCSKCFSQNKGDPIENLKQMNSKIERRIQSERDKPKAIKIKEKIFDILMKSFMALIVFSLVAGFVYLLSPKKDTLNVKELSWERSISIEKEKTVNESDWYLPSKARLHYTREEIHHYKDVLDHYETVTERKSKQVISGYEEVVVGHKDLGNGYFKEITDSRPIYETEYYTETREEPVYRQEPVYQTKYYYEIDKWFFERKVETTGKDKNPYWGEVVLAEKEREGSRSETYYVTAINKKEEEKKYKLDYNLWTDVNIEDVLNVKVHITGEIDILDENGEVLSVGTE